MLSKPFLATRKIAELLKVRKHITRKWKQQQELRAVKPGREFHMAAKGFEVFLNDHATREPACQDAGRLRNP